MQTEVAWYDIRHRQAAVSGYIWGNKNRFKKKKRTKKKIECGSWLPQQPKFGVACSFLLPTGGELCLCGRAAPLSPESHAKPELFTCLLLLLLLLLPATAAVEDCGICVGREEGPVRELLCAPAVNPLVFSASQATQCSGEESRAGWAACLFFAVRLVGCSAPVLMLGVGDEVQAAASHTHPPTSSQSSHLPTLCSKRPVMVSCSRQRSYISPAGCAAALQRAAAYKTVNN